MVEKIQKERWEKTYDLFKEGRMLEEINRLTSERQTLLDAQEGLRTNNKFTEFSSNSRRIAELEKEIAEKRQKYLAIEKNKEKIENILKFKKGLLDKAAELLEQIESIKKLEESKTKIEKEIRVLDEKRDKAAKRVREINEKLKDPKVPEAEKEKLRQEKEAKTTEIRENDTKFSECANARDKIDKMLAMTPNKEELNKALLKHEQLISKCDLIGANLVKGKDMEEIRAKLTDFEFKPNKEFAKKVKLARKINEKEKQPEEKKPEEKKPEEKKPEEKKPEEEKPEEKKPIELKPLSKWKQFLHNHPKIEAFKERVTNLFRRKKPEAQQPEEEKPEEKKPEEKKPEEKKPEEKKPLAENGDYEYIMKKIEQKGEDDILTQITEKGTQRWRESIRVDLVARHQADKQAAAEAYAKKYGQGENASDRYNHQDGVGDGR